MKSKIRIKKFSCQSETCDTSTQSDSQALCPPIPELTQCRTLKKYMIKPQWVKIITIAKWTSIKL